MKLSLGNSCFVLRAEAWLSERGMKIVEALSPVVCIYAGTICAMQKLSVEPAMGGEMVYL